MAATAGIAATADRHPAVLTVAAAIRLRLRMAQDPTAGIAATAVRHPAVLTVAAAIRRPHRIARDPTEEATTGVPDRTGAPDRTAVRVEAQVPTEADAEPNLVFIERRLPAQAAFLLPRSYLCRPRRP
jgi:hypothetical protein